LSVRAEDGTGGAGLPRRGWSGLLIALTFLTVLPLPRSLARQDFDLGDAAPWFPLVGGVVGGAAGTVRVGLDPLLGRGPSSALAILGLILATGALHQDGVADVADALGVRGDRPRRMAVMREATIGAFGGIALTVWALVLYACLDGLSAQHALRALVCAAATGRLAALLHARLAAPARRDGLGVRLRVGPLRLALALALAAAIAVAGAGPLRAGLSLAACALIAVLGAALARRAFGGSTGDTLGATIAVSELTVCLALLASWR